MVWLLVLALLTPAAAYADCGFCSLQKYWGGITDGAFHFDSSVPSHVQQAAYFADNAGWGAHYYSSNPSGMTITIDPTLPTNVFGWYDANTNTAAIAGWLADACSSACNPLISVINHEWGHSLPHLIFASVHTGSREPQVPIVVDYAPAPPTVEAFFQAADLVVVARLQSVTYAQKPIASHFKASVVEVLKDARKGQGGSTIDIYRFGGKRQTKNGVKDVDELHFARWSPGMEILVFLTWNPNVAEYLPIGPDSAFQLDPITKRVRAFGRGDVARAWHGREIARVLAEARAKSRIGIHQDQLLYSPSRVPALVAVGMAFSRRA